jgi:Protein of unknown function (DUF1570)
MVVGRKPATIARLWLSTCRDVSSRLLLKPPARGLHLFLMDQSFARAVRWAAIFLMALPLLACGGTAPQLPSKGGAPWRELKSVKITLWTNTSAKRATELFHQIDQRRQIITRAMNRAEQVAPIFVIALRSTDEVKAFIANIADAVAWNQRNPSFRPGVLVAADYPDESEAILFNHEMAHAISYSIIPVQPAWLAEGLASYFEMASLDENSTAQIGIPRADMVRALTQVPLMRTKQLLSCRDPSCRTPQLYMTGWALLSYLINTDLDRFNRYLQRLNQLASESQSLAWKETFPELSLDELDDDLARWLQKGTLAVPRIKVAVTPQPFRERLLSDVDVLAARGLLYTFFGTEKQARAEAEAALALDRTNLLAALLTLGLQLPYSLDDARKLAAAYPNDWRALMPLAVKVGPGPEAAELRARICAATKVLPDLCEVDPEE